MLILSFLVTTVSLLQTFKNETAPPRLIGAGRGACLFYHLISFEMLYQLGRLRGIVGAKISKVEASINRMLKIFFHR